MKIYIFSFFAIYRPGYHSYYNSEGTFIEKKYLCMFHANIIIDVTNIYSIMKGKTSSIAFGK